MTEGQGAGRRRSTVDCCVCLGGRGAVPDAVHDAHGRAAGKRVRSGDNVWTHTYNVTLNPCDGSFSGVGSQVGTISGPYGTQTVTGHLDGNTVSFTATRSDGIKWAMTGLIGDTLIATAWNADGTVIDTSPNALEFKVSKTTPIASTNYKNHGDYVSSQGGGSDAAHSCIGMPIHEGHRPLTVSTGRPSSRPLVV
jgi:hypothetical protein